VLPSPNNVAEVGEASLENPLPWDTIESAKFERLNRVEPYLAELRQRSTNRVATQRDFDYIREDIELFRKVQADKTVSLNEKLRLKEKDEADARQKARDKERLARNTPEKKIYDLTLKQADLPGLPLPTSKTNATVADGGEPLEIRAAVNTPAVMAANVAANSAAVAASDSPAAKANRPDSSTGEEEKALAVDATLEETQHILVDYLSLLPKEAVATVTK